MLCVAPYVHLIHFIVWRTPFNISCSVGSAGDERLVFVQLKAFIYLHFWKIFFWIKQSWVDSFSFQFSKDLVPLSSHLHCFQWEIICHPHLGSFVYNVSSFLAISELSLYHWCRKIWLWCASFSSLLVSCVLSSLNSIGLQIYRFLQTWTIFSHY